jgi:hypothetical protein
MLFAVVEESLQCVDRYRLPVYLPALAPVFAWVCTNPTENAREWQSLTYHLQCLVKLPSGYELDISVTVQL